jgi:hypothetical protein
LIELDQTGQTYAQYCADCLHHLFHHDDTGF